MIDLHIHSYYSDGTMSPEELVFHAKTKGAHTIAITDHDGMEGLREGEEAGRQYGVNVLSGIELSTEDEGEFYMHILGYCFNRENEELKKEVEIIKRKRVERNEKLLAALREIGCKLTNDDLQLREGQDFVGKPTIAMALMKKGYISSPKEAFKEGHYMRSDTVRKVHREKISAKSAIKLIKEAGGIPVLAHPMKIAYSAAQAEDSVFEILERQLIKMKEWGLAGMECYYSGHLPQDTKHLVHLANKHHLIITAGSDFHGLEFDNNIKLGGFPIDENFDEKKIISEIQKGNLE
ncbi:MAG: PHP domain-containing protein [Eubacteriales bacterium]|nr:PHP domain-containing protein [Eubacteriales bacterium]MDD3199225.1 PHP domain-containing protein [Eubacteriales bacterium]MDD4121426.1 PHP domain-containing protein [Eubacteriales bacterium]MDD4629356.1 PHP domain-containing protein [Eubacteriales bacterium]